jgi:hypothetical protein
LQIAIPEGDVTEGVLDAALESVTRLDEQLIGSGAAPTFHEGLRARGIQWRPEPPGAERFDHAATVMSRGHGDCDDLAPWRAASMRHTGEDVGATAVVVPSGPNRWHAIVKRSDGRIEDPSREAGMGHKVVGAPAVCAPMFLSPSGVSGYAPRAAIAMRPVARGWEARADLPWTDTDAAIVALQRAPVAAAALVGACIGACLVGEASGAGDETEADVLTAIAAILDGHDASDVLEALPPESLARVCSILPSLVAYCDRRIAAHVFDTYQTLAPVVGLGRGGACVAGVGGGPVVVRF